MSHLSSRVSIAIVENTLSDGLLRKEDSTPQASDDWSLKDHKSKGISSLRQLFDSSPCMVAWLRNRTIEEMDIGFSDKLSDAKGNQHQYIGKKIIWISVLSLGVLMEGF